MKKKIKEEKIFKYLLYVIVHSCIFFKQSLYMKVHINCRKDLRFYRFLFIYSQKYNEIKWGVQT